MDPNPDLFLCVLLGYGPCVGAHACRVPDTARSLSFTIFLYHTLTLHKRSINARS